MHGDTFNPRTRLVMDPSSRGAALLLMQVRKIAIDEVTTTPSSKKPIKTRWSILSKNDDISTSSSYYSDSDEESCAERIYTSPPMRSRTVSVGSLDEPRRVSSHASQRPSIMTPRRTTTGSPENLSGGEATSPHLELPFHPNRGLVGTTIKGAKVKGVLRKKFSWKNFPELEAYLIHHRPQYLMCSSSLNYTAEQKRYNNKLTQGLLDLATEEGYLFEGFTFPAVRDRIRCYYKSFVQAGKKKKRKKRR